jgi:hypothetical protein
MNIELRQNIEQAIKVLKSKQVVISQSEIQALTEILSEVIKTAPITGDGEMSEVTSSKVVDK